MENIILYKELYVIGTLKKKESVDFTTVKEFEKNLDEFWKHKECKFDPIAMNLKLILQYASFFIRELELMNLLRYSLLCIESLCKQLLMLI